MFTDCNNINDLGWILNRSTISALPSSERQCKPTVQHSKASFSSQLFSPFLTGHTSKLILCFTPLLSETHAICMDACTLIHLCPSLLCFYYPSHIHTQTMSFSYPMSSSPLWTSSSLTSCTFLAIPIYNHFFHLLILAHVIY